MGDRSIQQRLAAVLAADVVGYTRLMEKDTEGTVAAWQAVRDEVINPTVDAHSGRIVKLTGDGFLAEFPTVNEAVKCGIELQQGFAESTLDFRIGINLGDIIDDGQDIHGEGVNVAARIEALAEPGGISISGGVYEQVRNRIEATYEDMGDQEVKNVSAPVKVFAIRLEGAAGVASQAEISVANKPSIAVLPFDNMSGDPEQEYFSDGITEDIITDLSKVSALFVIARNSSFTYKGKVVDVKQVAADLGVRYVLEGSVRKATNRVRITAQLLDGVTGGHLWADRYDRDLNDIFLVQDEVTQNIVEALKLKLSLKESNRVGVPITSNIEAYDYALRARELMHRHTPEAHVEARKLLEQAIELDHEFSTAYAFLAVVLFSDFTNGWNDATEKALDQGLELATMAVEVDPDGPQGYWALALGHMWKRNLDQAIEEIDRAVALGPNHSEAYAVRGLIFAYAGQPIEAVASLEKSMRLNPHFPDLHLHFLAHAHFLQANYGEAVALLQRRIRLYPETDISRVLLASCFGHMGRVDEARNQWAKALEMNPTYSIEQKARVLPYRNPADWDRFIDGLHKAGLPE
ncbi:MAG: tetratricopeptide repeat protein [SAR202 cluster bacterium]|jgi:adenylate cyclase|nr:adenylate/guanylate cyclase domain-containing protein [Rhodospirillales bacterium]MQG68339.1 tetratricopeptide repeat protein [SAR202 cluster bacterium]